MKTFPSAATGFSAAAFLLLASAPVLLAASNRSPAAMVAAGAELRQSLQGEAAKLGALSPWQKRILEEEILAQPQSYVLQERTEADGTSRFDFDLETVKRLLSLGCGDAPARCGAEVLVRVARACIRCEEKVPAVQRIVEQQLARRGFRPVVLSAASLAGELARARTEIGSAENSLEPSEWEGERAWQQAMTLRTLRTAPGPASAGSSAATADAAAPRALVLVSLQELEEDSSHASPDAPADDPGRPAIRVALGYRERAGSIQGGAAEWSWAVARWTAVHASETLGAPLGRLFSDAVSELVVRLDLGLRPRGVLAQTGSSEASVGGSVADAGGILVRILGVRDFQQYTRVRNVLSAAIQSAGFDEPLEQALRRGEAVWRVLPRRPGVQASALLTALRESRPGDPGLGEMPTLRILDGSNAEDRRRIAALAESEGDEDQPLFRDATVTVELPGEERKR